MVFPMRLKLRFEQSFILAQILFNRVNHVISRTALPGLPIKDTDKDYLLGLIKRLSRLYFVDVLGFAIMGNHFHLVARMHPEDEISNSDIIKRWQDYYGDKVEMPADRMAEAKKRLCSLGAYVKDIKQNFTRLNAA